MKIIIVFLAVCYCVAFILFAALLVGAYNGVKLRLKARKVQIGDTLTITSYTDDPFDKPITVSGTVIDKKNGYVLLRKNDRTFSMNLIRTLEFSEVIIQKESEQRPFQQRNGVHDV